ncbi:PAS domain S-box protein [Streptomyces sp. WMMC500]|uniref:PAS domain-containing sensor histidine kinase n=1 Tax=Streptomyces sp. WMMC500 TaxID=3015154 RepID=UPI00248C7FA1|nr:PAS domain S-box protein [Streptomyces sp. WMMC500]WBB61939.1 PAS domain S-box protein [Streptomyces sp. WMMC500]
MRSTQPPRTLAEAQEVLRRQETELDEGRRQIAELSRELSDADHGLIALHTELEEARGAAARLAAIVTSSGDAMISISPQRTIQTWNPGAARLLGHDADAMVGRSADELIPEGALPAFEDALARTGSGEHVEPVETRWRSADGGLVDVSVTVSAMRDGDGALIGYSIVGQDIGRRLALQSELAGARAEREVIADRERIARDLHDMVIQRLFAAGLTLQGVTAFLDHAQAVSRIKGVIGELDATIQELRNAIFDLHRAPQHTTSLRAQIFDATTAARRNLGFAPTVAFEGPVDAAIPDAIAVHLLAVLRESLSNIGKHAHASAAEVSLHTGEELLLTVSDNGRGVGPSTRRSGLANLRERAEELGGTFEIADRPSGGTRLAWRIPLARHRDGTARN